MIFIIIDDRPARFSKLCDFVKLASRWIQDLVTLDKAHSQPKLKITQASRKWNQQR
jgi:hypothetical protein